ncbi:MAG: hypothetical protein FWF59_11700 [Turicibacter sp.]|nr:hypothetical protein [Turicibacter sp.]
MKRKIFIALSLISLWGCAINEEDTPQPQVEDAEVANPLPAPAIPQDPYREFVRSLPIYEEIVEMEGGEQSSFVTYQTIDLENTLLTKELLTSIIRNISLPDTGVLVLLLGEGNEIAITSADVVIKNISYRNPNVGSPFPDRLDWWNLGHGTFDTRVSRMTWGQGDSPFE